MLGLRGGVGLGCGVCPRRSISACWSNWDLGSNDEPAEVDGRLCGVPAILAAGRVGKWLEDRDAARSMVKYRGVSHKRDTEMS